MFEKIANSATAGWSQAVDVVTQAVTPSLRLGVTGLARSGKTVFITALVHNLLMGGRLPFFDPYAQGRIRKAYLEPQPDDAVARFDYEGNLAKITGREPEWPQSTTQISQVRVTFEYEPISALWRAFGTSKLHIDIVDYPGEWLLDLPLLDMNFKQWSNSAWTMSKDKARAQAAVPWHEFMASLDALSKQDEALARKGAELFTNYLRTCRSDELSLSSLPPGRFLVPGHLAASPAVTFFPLPLPDTASPTRDSLWSMMERRYEAYKTHVVRPFFRDHFARLDRQIVLADVLAAVNAGADAMLDLERALSEILICFRSGSNSWLSLIVGRRIDRIVFAATKADHIHHVHYQKLEAILEAIMSKSIARADFAGADVRTFAMASVRTTREGRAQANGDPMPVIVGTPLKNEKLGGRVFDGTQELAIFPGDLPSDPKLVFSSDWKGNSTQFVRFRPPVSDTPEFGKVPALPHIRLDQALNFLLADRLG